MISVSSSSAAISDVQHVTSPEFGSMLVGFACIEFFEEHADLGCLGAGEPFEDGEGIVPAAACGVGPARRRTALRRAWSG